VIKTKRIYDPRAQDDGYRLLVMHLWPRGVRKDAVDGWEKELGPSTELLRVYRAGGVEWAEFARRYRAEMRKKAELLEAVAKRARKCTVTLLCGCEDESRCHRTLLTKILSTDEKRIIG
jgi:uncharacterized protein YeaO (DUF488 family)